MQYFDKVVYTFSADNEPTGSIDSGEIVEAFACGTAAVLTPVAEFRSHQGDHVVGSEPGERTMQIRAAILDIQYGRAADTHGWMRRVV